MGGFLEGRYDNGWEGGWHRFDGTLEKRTGYFGLELLLYGVCMWWLRRPGGGGGGGGGFVIIVKILKKKKK